MPTHWTYERFCREDDLEQGDILSPSSRLRGIFSSVHPHFCDPKYLGFLVATQTCDLVRRRSTPKAAYISLSVIRPLLQVVVEKLIPCAVPPVVPGLFPLSGKVDAKRLLERVFNQNEQALGLFFLHEDADSGIGEQAVAFLRITVSVRSEHYDSLIESRVGRLAPEFQAKLGWLLGNLYGRPATPDWSDKPDGKRKLENLIKFFLEDDGSSGPVWVDDDVIREASARGVDLKGKRPEDLESLRPAPRYLRALEEAASELSRAIPGLDKEQLDKFKNRLMNNGKFKKLFTQGSNDR